MILSRVLALLAALVVAAGAQAQALWLTVEGPERTFTVQLPGTPEYKVTPPLHSYSLQRGLIDYVVQSVSYPATVDVSQPRAVLQAALDGTAPHLVGGKWDKIDFKQVQGVPAVEAVGTFKDGNAFRNLVVLKGRQLVSLGFRGPTGTTKFPDADRFISSLRVNP